MILYQESMNTIAASGAFLTLDDQYLSANLGGIEVVYIVLK
jgi:hypothetical protein